MKSSEYPEEFPRIFRGNAKFGFLGIYRRNSEEISFRRNILLEYRGKLYSSEKTDEFRGNIIDVREPLESRWGILKIPRKFRRTSRLHRNSVGISSDRRQDFNYKYKHPSSSSFTPYLHPPSHFLYTRI